MFELDIEKLNHILIRNYIGVKKLSEEEYFTFIENLYEKQKKQIFVRQKKYGKLLEQYLKLLKENKYHKNFAGIVDNDDGVPLESVIAENGGLINKLKERGYESPYNKYIKDNYFSESVESYFYRICTKGYDDELEDVVAYEIGDGNWKIIVKHRTNGEEQFGELFYEIIKSLTDGEFDNSKITGEDSFIKIVKENVKAGKIIKSDGIFLSKSVK